MSNPWNGKAVLEVFWWNCWNGNYPFDWYTYLAKLAPRIAGLGFDGIWTPPPCKDTDAHNNMGYTPYDYYDIGQKNQKGFPVLASVPRILFFVSLPSLTPTGLKSTPIWCLIIAAAATATLLRRLRESPRPRSRLFIQTGLPVPAPGGGRGTGLISISIRSIGTAGEIGSQTMAAQTSATRAAAPTPGTATRTAPPAPMPGPGSCGSFEQTGVDGFRFDDVKGYPPEVVEDVLFNAMGDGREYFCVGEFVTGSTSDVDNWASATLNRSGTFDYPLRFALGNLVAQNGFSDVGNLPSQQQQNRFKTVPFVNNHDNYDDQVSTWIDRG